MSNKPNFHIQNIRYRNKQFHKCLNIFSFIGTRRTRAFRRQSGRLADGSVRERLFSLEEERKEREIFKNQRLASIDEKLGGVMLALQEMCRLIKQVTETRSRPNE